MTRKPRILFWATFICITFIRLASYAKAPAKKEPVQIKMIEEGTAAYKTKGGEVFSCKTFSGKTYFPSCRSARELDNHSTYAKWCEEGKPKEVIIYQTDLGQFECPIDHDLCTDQEYAQNPKFCAYYGRCTTNKGEQHPADQTCFDTKKNKVKKKR